MPHETMIASIIVLCRAPARAYPKLTAIVCTCIQARMIVGDPPYPDECEGVSIGGTSPLLAALTAPNLQNWGCSIYEVR